MTASTSAPQQPSPRAPVALGSLYLVLSTLTFLLVGDHVRGPAGPLWFTPAGLAFGWLLLVGPRGAWLVLVARVAGGRHLDRDRDAGAGLRLAGKAGARVCGRRAHRARPPPLGARGPGPAHRRAAGGLVARARRRPSRGAAHARPRPARLGSRGRRPRPRGERARVASVLAAIGFVLGAAAELRFGETEVTFQLQLVLFAGALAALFATAGMVADARARRGAEVESTRWRALVEASPAAVARVDGDGRWHTDGAAPPDEAVAELIGRVAAVPAIADAVAPGSPRASTGAWTTTPDGASSRG